MSITADTTRVENTLPAHPRSSRDDPEPEKITLYIVQVPVIDVR